MKKKQIVTNSSNDKDLKVKVRKPLYRCTRMLVFIVLCFMHSFLSVAIGVLSSSATHVKKELQLSDNQFGTMGTILGLGNVIGSVVYTILADKISKKIILFVSMTMCSGSHVFFFLTNNYYLVLLIRFVSGLGQVCGYPYFHHWPEQFGIQKYKSILVTIMGLSGAFGYVWGYLINIIISSVHWRFGLTLETIGMGICLFILFFIERAYFDNDFFFLYNKDIGDRKDTTGSFDEVEDSIFAEHHESHEEGNENSGKNIYLSLLTNLEFVCLVIVKSNIYFVSMAQIFWYSDYLEDSLKVTDHKKIFLSYTLNLTVASNVGIMLFGSIIEYLGGYKKRICVELMLACQCLACLFGIISGYAETFWTFTCLNSAFNFFFAAASTFCIVCSIRTVPNKVKGSAVGFFIFICEVTAFFPAPVVYSMIKTYFNDGRVAMKSVLHYPLVALVALIVVNVYRKRHMEEEKDEKAEELKDKEEEK